MINISRGQFKATNGMTCDGGYIKLLQEDSGKNLAKFDNDARYTIMFGPDRCGSTDKVYFLWISYFILYFHFFDCPDISRSISFFNT